MPFEIVRNDIVNMQVDAIVNTASIQPVIGYGVDSGIHQKAGEKLLAARKRIGKIPIGEAAVTPGYDLAARYVIHTVCPVWQGGGCGEAELLQRCYERSLELARRRWCRSIAFPLMAAGNHGFPKEIALQTAVRAISAFLMHHEMQVYLVVFSRSAYQASEKLFQGIASYIDERYVQEKNFEQYGVEDKCALRAEQQNAVLREQLKRRREEALAAQWEEAAPQQAAPDTSRLSGFEPVWDNFAEEDICSAEPVCEDAPCDLWDASAGFECDSQAAVGRWEPAASAAPEPKSIRSAAPQFPAPGKNLKTMLQEADAGFSETLLRLIDKTGKKDSEIYKKANIDRKLFSKIRKNKNYQPSKPTAVAFAIALEMDLQQTKDFLSRAGYALSHSSKFDIIIEYCILNRNYNVHEINMILFEFDQSLLGG